MTFSTRNSFYLRISTSIVLPVYVYLDERHVDWMSDTVLQYVLSDLQPLILPKLKAEAEGLTGSASAQKKATVDTYRGNTYQFCYFIRKTEPHSVVIKTRNFRAAPTQNIHWQPTQASSSKKRGKRKATGSSKPKKRRRNEDQLDDNDNDNDVDDAMGDERSEEEEGANIPLELEIEEEEEKPKPILGLRYQGFSIYGQCLCVVVEPWPVVRSKVVAPVFGAAGMAAPVERSTGTRAETPLFLPEENEEPATERHSNVNQPFLDQILKDVDVSDNEDDMGGMLEFSQVLHNIGDSRAGATNDDEDDIDDSILFGDADERREL